MNRYPLWKYAIMAIALLVGLLYTLPNFFGEAPAVQVSSAKATPGSSPLRRPRRRRCSPTPDKPDFVQFDGNWSRRASPTPSSRAGPTRSAGR